MAAPIILCDTKGMTNERWLECRMHGPKGDIPYTVGGSDVATIFGVSPWTTPLELWLIKKGRMKPPAKANAGQLEMGHMLEPIAAYFYQQKTGNLVSDDTHLYQHAEHPYALANFDRRYTRRSDGAKGILECKSCTFHKASDWSEGAIPYYYEFQLRFYLAVADVGIGAFSAFWGNNPDSDFAMPEITRDREKEDIIFEKLDEWIWSLEHDKPPTMEDVSPKLALESLARIYGESKASLPTVEFSATSQPSARSPRCRRRSGRRRRSSKKRTGGHGTFGANRRIDGCTRTRRLRDNDGQAAHRVCHQKDAAGGQRYAQREIPRRL